MTSSHHPRRNSLRRGTARRARLLHYAHPHSEPNPFKRNTYKKARGPLRRPSRLAVLCGGAIHFALFTQASNPTACSRRLPPAPRFHPHNKPNLFKRNTYENKRGAC
jgi:hypothetical protein